MPRCRAALPPPVFLAPVSLAPASLAPVFLVIATLGLLAACAKTGAGPAKEPWRSVAGPGWELVEPVRFERAVFINAASVTGEGDRRAGTVLINFVVPGRTRTGQPILSQRYVMEADCAGRSYRPRSGAVFGAYGGLGEPIGELAFEDESPRPAVAGSTGEQIVDALCSRKPMAGLAP